MGLVTQTLNTGSGGQNIALDNCGDSAGTITVGKLVLGPYGTDSGPVYALNPLPVSYQQATVTVGQTSIGISFVQMLSGASLVVYQGVQVKALNSNTANVYVGMLSGVSSSNGFELGAGEGVFVPTTNINSVYLVASSPTQKVSYMAY